jgi:hypothetical protein
MPHTWAARRGLACALLRGRPGRFVRLCRNDTMRARPASIATRTGGTHMGRQAHAFLQQCLGRVDTKCAVSADGIMVMRHRRRLGGAVTTGESTKSACRRRHIPAVRRRSGARSLRAKGTKNAC